MGADRAAAFILLAAQRLLPRLGSYRFHLDLRGTATKPYRDMVAWGIGGEP